MDSIAQKDKMLPNNTVLRIDQTNSGVSANCEGGSFCNGGVVVGCDGVNSKASTRSEMCRLSSEKDCGRLSSDGGDKYVCKPAGKNWG
jgi:2-polyprenyl-6-methoxyphenol hydroxylase-like FAD-dependent oxidoreductase